MGSHGKGHAGTKTFPESALQSIPGTRYVYNIEALNKLINTYCETFIQLK